TLLVRSERPAAHEPATHDRAVYADRPRHAEVRADDRRSRRLYGAVQRSARSAPRSEHRAVRVRLPAIQLRGRAHGRRWDIRRSQQPDRPVKERAVNRTATIVVAALLAASSTIRAQT